MSWKGILGIALVFGIGFLLLGLTKCGYDRIEKIREVEAAPARE